MRYSHPQLLRINHLISELDHIYHEMALRFKLSDSAFSILYTLCVEGDGSELSLIVNHAGLAKQTVNSALRKLEEENIITLVLDGKRKKKIFLTEKGIKLCEATVIKIIELENNIFLSWGDEKSNRYIEETREYNKLMMEGFLKLCK